MNRHVQRIRWLFGKGLWDIRATERPWLQAAGIRTLRMATASVVNFKKDDGLRRASGLTFYTLLSVVPILALLLGVAKGFGFENHIEKQLLQYLRGQEEVVSRLIQFAMAMLENTKAGVFAGVGVALLFWSVVRVLGNLEDALNRIWNVSGRRPPGRMIVDYLAASILAPVLWISASTGSVMVSRYVRLASENFYGAGWIKPLLSPLLYLLPYSVIALALAFLYIFLPNRNVPWRSGFAAGILTGAMYLVFQWIYISFQVGVGKYNAAYGSFAALPLFLVWLNTSWIIILFGAELSYAHANARTWEYAADQEAFSSWSEKALALLVAREVCLDFAAGKPPRAIREIAGHLDLPRRLTARLLEDLARAGVVSPLCAAEGEPPVYQPSRPLDQVRPGWVLARMEHLGENDLSLIRPPDLSRIRAVLEAFSRAGAEAPENKPLHEI